MNDQNNQLTMLKALLAEISSEDIYRPVFGPSGELLAEGVETIQEKLIDEFCTIDFAGKTVVDLGCNFGLFTFLAAERGALQVTGVDSLPQIVKGAELLASLKKVRNVKFTIYDFEKQDNRLGPFDMVMLVDFFGKSNIRKQKVKPIIDFMKSIATDELLFAIRPINRIVKDLKTTPERFAGLYPDEFIRNDAFYLLEYITSLLGDSWRIDAVTPYDGKFRKYKLLFHCRKRY